MKLQEIRKNLGISQQKLADIIGVSRSTIAMWETGGSQPDNTSLQLLADYFHVSVDYLLGRESENIRGPEAEPEIDVNSIEYALYGEVKELDEEEKKQLLELVKLMRKRRREM